MKKVVGLEPIRQDFDMGVRQPFANEGWFGLPTADFSVKSPFVDETYVESDGVLYRQVHQPNIVEEYFNDNARNVRSIGLRHYCISQMYYDITFSAFNVGFKILCFKFYHTKSLLLKQLFKK